MGGALCHHSHIVFTKETPLHKQSVQNTFHICVAKKYLKNEKHKKAFKKHLKNLKNMQHNCVREKNIQKSFLVTILSRFCQLYASVP